MKTIEKASVVWVLSLILVSCGYIPTPTPELKHSVGKAIEGTYSVDFAGEPIGILTLRDDHYFFTPNQNTQLPLDAKDRLSFVKDTQGYYRVDYYDSVDQNIPLEGLELLAVLSYIEFGPEQSKLLTGNIFLIRSDDEKKILYFHTIGSELETWRITKPWD